MCVCGRGKEENYNHIYIFRNYFYDGSGTEEEYNELHILLEDIISYRTCRDMELQRMQEKEARKRKIEEKQKGLDMKKAAMEGISSKHFFKSANKRYKPLI